MTTYLLFENVFKKETSCKVLIFVANRNVENLNVASIRKKRIFLQTERKSTTDQNVLTFRQQSFTNINSIINLQFF